MKAGGAYDCLGQYVHGEPECDGDRPCRWRSTCRIYRDFCSYRGISPSDELGMLPKSVMIPMIKHLLAHHVPGGQIPSSQVLRGFDRFLGGVTSELSRPVVHLDAEHARQGELYVHTWKGRCEGQYRAKILRVRRLDTGTIRRDPTLCRYQPSTIRRVTPTIEFAVPLDVLLFHYPGARHLAFRWRYTCRDFRPIGCVAVKVYTERIDDCGRLLVRLLEDNLIKGVRLNRSRGRVFLRGASKRKRNVKKT